MIEKIKSYCDDKIEYVGLVNGKEKAKLFSQAKATILLTQLPDACPVIMAESLMSGTPVIGSIYGAMPTGFVLGSFYQQRIVISRPNLVKMSLLIP